LHAVILTFLKTCAEDVTHARLVSFDRSSAYGVFAFKPRARASGRCGRAFSRPL
jgi:hypothetical protein